MYFGIFVFFFVLYFDVLHAHTAPATGQASPCKVHFGTPYYNVASLRPRDQSVMSTILTNLIFAHASLTRGFEME